ncbi:hypothetical protein GN244_ATG01974 [Phytophthora infestans]|uniref:Uncharacterized protein n=1 Tax=Phytophthora infestans TaxID=4787 RepID=A0A833WLV0_PHYIN|nr:hypothetical protein GN244_ATG01974 [Phytophthora infestans]
MKWYCNDEKRIMLFSCRYGGQQDRYAAKVRIVKAAKVTTNTCRRVELAVAVSEGTVGLLMPARRVEPHLLPAPTLTTVGGGRVAVPVMNLVGSRVRLPTRELLGTWAPTTYGMEILEMTGSLSRDRVKQWL